MADYVEVQWGDGSRKKVVRNPGESNSDISNRIQSSEVYQSSWAGTEPTTEDSSQPQPQAYDDPSVGEIAGGLTAEVTGSALGQLGAATAAAPLLAIPVAGVPLAAATYAGISFTTGYYSNILAQNIEGRSEISQGRAIFNGVLNVIPFSNSVKAAKASIQLAGKEVTRREIIKQVAKKEAGRGALIGASESVVVAGIDRQELPTPEEFASYTGAGATFGWLLGNVVGGVSTRVKKTTEKLADTPPEKVDDLIVDGTLDADGVAELHNKLNPEVKPLVGPQILESSVSASESKMVDRLVRESGTDPGYFRKKLAAFTPFRNLGREIEELSWFYKNANEATQQMGGKINRSVVDFLGKNPELSDDVDGFFKSGVVPNSLKNNKILGDLGKAREMQKDMQLSLMEQLTTRQFSHLPKDKQDEALKVVTQSLKGGYTTREYRMHTSLNWKPDPKLRSSLRQEYIKTIKAEDANLGVVRKSSAVVRQAQQELQKLEDGALINKQESPSVSSNPSYDGVLLEKKALSDLQRKFMGEIVEPGEKIRGTLSKLSKLVYNNQADIEIEKSLLRMGLGVTKNPPPGYVTLKLNSGVESNVFIPREVQFSLQKTHQLQPDSVSSDDTLRLLTETLTTGIGISKASKVLLNPPSYSVNYLGGVFSMASMGMNPASKGVRSGVRVALSEYGKVDDLLGGKTPESRKAFLDFVNDVKRLGLAQGNIDVSGIRDSLRKNNLVSETADKLLDPIAKAYQVTDVAHRVGVWSANRIAISEFFPTLPGEQVKKIAAIVTNDTFQNYDKLPQWVRTGSRYGAMPQFVSFTAEFLRNTTNQVRNNAKMIAGTFGDDLGLDLSKANIKAMQVEGAKRAASLAAVTVGTEALRRSFNNDNGITPEQEEAWKFSVGPEWDRTKSLVFMKDKNDSNKVTYANASYINPFALVNEAGVTALSDKKGDALSNYLIDNFVGEGNFFSAGLFRAIANKDVYGKTISTRSEEERVKKGKELISYLVADVFKPGIGREADKFYETLYSEEPRYTLSELFKRQWGLRLNKTETDQSAVMRIRPIVNNILQLKSEYTSQVKRGRLTEDQRVNLYNDNRDSIASNFQTLFMHGGNLKILDMPEETIQEVFKKTGLSSYDIAMVLDNKVPDFSYDIAETVGDQYEDMMLNLEDRGITKKIASVAKTDPVLAKKFIAIRKRDITLKSKDLNQRELLFSKFTTEQQVKYISDNNNLYRPYLRKGILRRPSIIKLHGLGY
jgi:hypothetical protein